ncbi:MAG: winged helix-turn-helix transcriptional regulator [Chloroflexi bacterium]|nr:winged helix-turn-helix transcriptional regulator [Chloroflexota bacterium]MCH8116285.1 winged helix-turn-helix transcriptional regulator [Chloroflexota bacterium]MCI0804924.1 winged helix-turn-helix transcriptional regulator [Chloroflexota bacterium]MCI0809719.1 winged helix-turn-helix transcriptional regulator [Chloroflexota bacterium]MCI0835445.1 winged helix-turn-helix transcriptional regulator [Chloroflexota bacterium]
MEAALKAMSDPTRREILRLVQNEEMPAGAIASNFPVSRPAISQHLAVLKTAGLIDERRSGAKRLYRTRVAGMAELKAFLEMFWDVRLERLKAAVEAENEKEETSDDDEQN